MKHSEQLNELAAALSKAQAEIEGAKQDAKNPYFKSDYADLTSVWEACRGPLTKNGLSITQTLDYENDKTLLITTLLHNSGQWITSRLPLTVGKMDSQGVGSAITYARRYALGAMVSVCPADDDAESTMALSEADKLILQKKFDKAPELVDKFRQKLNKWDLTTMSRSEFMRTLEFFENREKNQKANKKGKVDAEPTVA